MPGGMSERRRRGTSLATQVTVAGVGFGLLVAAVFGLLVHAVREQRDATRRTTAAADFVATGNRLERLVIDTETGQRGFVISGDPGFLAPLDQARAQIPEAFARLRGLAGDAAASAPPVRPAVRRRRLPARVERPRRRRSRAPTARARGAWSAAAAASGASTRLRRRFDALLADRRLAAAAQAARPATARGTATILGVAGVVGSILVFAVFATYVVRAILAPVRRTAATAERIARGDFDARVEGADHAQAELGSMVRGFNAMADALAGRPRRARGGPRAARAPEPRARRRSAASSSPSSASSRTRSAASPRRRPSARRWRRRRASRRWPTSSWPAWPTPSAPTSGRSSPATRAATTPSRPPSRAACAAKTCPSAWSRASASRAGPRPSGAPSRPTSPRAGCRSAPTACPSPSATSSTSRSCRATRSSAC